MDNPNLKKTVRITAYITRKNDDMLKAKKRAGINMSSAVNDALNKSRNYES